jgi:hypothetical protein
MSKLEFFSAGLIVAAMFATPAMAREHHPKSWHDSNGAYVEPSRVVRVGGRHCIRAPDVGAFASAPYAKPPCEPASWY